MELSESPASLHPTWEVDIRYNTAASSVIVWVSTLVRASHLEIRRCRSGALYGRTCLGWGHFPLVETSSKFQFEWINYDYAGIHLVGYELFQQLNLHAARPSLTQDINRLDEREGYVV